MSKHLTLMKADHPHHHNENDDDHNDDDDGDDGDDGDEGGWGQPNAVCCIHFKDILRYLFRAAAAYLQ